MSNKAEKGSTFNSIPAKKADFEFKVTVAGDYNVGKTQILNRIIKGAYTDKSVSSVGIEYAYRKATIDGKFIKM